MLFIEAEVEFGWAKIIKNEIRTTSTALLMLKFILLFFWAFIIWVIPPILCLVAKR